MLKLKKIILPFLLVVLCFSMQTFAQLSQLQGLSPDQLEQQAKSMGFTPEQYLQYMQSKAQQSQTTQQLTNTTPPKVTPDTSVVIAPNANKPLSSYKVPAFDNRGDAADLPGFGYNIFSYSPSTFIPAENVPTPTNYVFGPGDEIIVTLWGETELTQDVFVSKNGDITIPNVGVINVNGLSMGELKSRLLDKFSQVYSSLKTGKTNLTISTGQLRSVKVYILGEVSKPGGYVLPALSSAFTALYYSGGPRINGTLRDVKVLRGGKTVANIDLYDYLIKGDQSEDIRLQDEDIIFIPPAGKRVAITGSIFRPAIYELKKGEKLDDLLKYAGGLNFDAYYQRVHINRVIPFAQRSKYLYNILSLDLNFNSVNDLENSNYTLEDGDVVNILSVNDRPQNIVSIKGDVKKPGDYELTSPQMTIRDLIYRADTLYPDAFLDKAVLIRTLPSEKKQIIPFNLKKALDGDPSNNYVLENRDEVQIYNQDQFQPTRSVEIYGAVKNPGTYTRLQNMTVSDLIILAGGLTDSATTKNIQIARLDTASSQVYAESYNTSLPKDYWNVDPDSDFKLEDYDRVFVRLDSTKIYNHAVTISGQVKFPGTYTILYRGERLLDFIRRAGGFTSEAYSKGIYIKRSNAEFSLLRKIPIPDTLLFSNYQGQPLFDEAALKDEFGNRIPIDWSDIKSDTNSIYNIKLLPDDIVEIPKDNGTVTVVGDVNLPSTVPYKEGAGLDYYIKQAGGYTITSSVGDEVVIQPNGAKWHHSGWFFIPDPDILSGATILVPSAVQTASSDTWPIIRDIITVVSSSAVLILTISRLK
jgi:protein involved in polysaccharide export with SLBB domain